MYNNDDLQVGNHFTATLSIPLQYHLHLAVLCAEKQHLNGFRKIRFGKE